VACGKVKDYSRSYIQKLINDGMILVNGKPVKSNYKIKQNDEILARIPEPQVLDVVAEDMMCPYCTRMSTL